MAFEPGGMADKLGNRYEGRWVVRQLLRLLNEEVQSVTVELIGPDERGVDLLVVKKDGTRQLQQCKARFGSRESWSMAALKDKGILDRLKDHLTRDLKQEFFLISALPAKSFADICNSARLSNDDPKDFFQYQIQDIGVKRQNIFQDFCDALKLNPEKDEDLTEAFGYLKRTYIDLFPDNHTTYADLLTWAGFLLTGEPETAISVLSTYAEKDKYRKPIYADELRRHLADSHKIYPKQIAHDLKLGPAVEELKQQFSETIGPGLIGGAVISREETSQVIESIENGQDVVIHGAAGYGKSGVLYELTEQLERQNIPFIPVRLDRRIPGNTAKQFGKDLGLPESPGFSLAGLAAGRKGVLILDQLDAIRWTSAHSSDAMDVCKELVRQVRSLCRAEKCLVIVFACRTFDLENDPEIKSLFENKREQRVVKILVKEFSDERLKKIIGKGFNSLTSTQKRILSCPQNLAIWMELKKEQELPDFRSATELMRRFWENRRQVLQKKAGISADQMDEFLEPLLDYMEDQGEVSVPASKAAKNPSVRDVFISFGILQISSNRISFCHQQYLDYLIAERLLDQMYSKSSSVLDWLGPKKKQSLFRREQLRQVFALLADESPSDFFNIATGLLESATVRFHIKHLILELIGQLDKIMDEIGRYFLKLTNDPKWQDHVLETVFLGHSPWISYLLGVDVIQKWLGSADGQEVNQALQLLRSVAERIPDSVTDLLVPWVDKGGDWPLRILNTLCWKLTDDSEKMFELRLRLVKIGHAKDFVDWKSLCARYPLRAVLLIEAVLSTWNVDDDEPVGRKDRLERWYDKDMTALKIAVRNDPARSWDLLMLHIDRLTNIQAGPYDKRLQKWKNKRLSSRETNMAQGVVELVISAGSLLAADAPETLIIRTRPLEQSFSPVIQEIIMAVYAHLPAVHAEKGITWLLEKPARFRLGPGYHEPEWMPAVRLIKALSPYCSDALFQQLENAIFHYHDPEEKKKADYCLKIRREGYVDHYWGKTQYFLLPALDAGRIQPSTRDFICVLNRKFANYPEKRFLRGGVVTMQSVGSKLAANVEKISDKAWLRIITSKKVTDRNTQKVPQAGQDRILATSIHQFAGSMSQIAKRFPERFGRLALQFPENVHPSYVSAVLEGLGTKLAKTEVPESERNAWQPARVGTIEAVLDRYQSCDDRETAMSFCRIISERADEKWSDKTIGRLVRYACNHPDLEKGELNIHCDQKSDEASIEILFQNTVNCVRGKAADAIGQLLWENKQRFDEVRPGIESLIRDSHPVVRMAALEAIEPVMNIDRHLAVHWFCETCKKDLRVAASPRALHFFNHTVPNHIDQVGPIIEQMVFSNLDDVAEEGAKQVTARHLFYGLFEKEFAECCMGTVPQRKGAANAAVSLLNKKDYSGKCRELIRSFMNDPEKDVRDELRGILNDTFSLSEPDHYTFIKEYAQSQAFADDPDLFIFSLKQYSGSLIPAADAIFAACETFSTTLKEKTRDMGSRFPHAVAEMSSILLRLYEQAHGRKDEDIADQCLNLWDLFFENRVGITIELTKLIQQ